MVRAGFAETEFTPEPGLDLFGQMHRRVATHARDPLMVSAVAFEPDGEPPILLASVDVCVLPDLLVRRAQHAVEASSGIPADRAVIHATHTHVAPATMDLMSSQADAAFLDRLVDAIASAANDAVNDIGPLEVFSGVGRTDAMGWNRRGRFSDGTSRMYGHAEDDGWEAPEGPRDPALPVVAFRRPDGSVRGVLAAFSTHPNSLEGESFYSADVPGEFRRTLKAMLEGPVVVYLTGAAGNTAPSVLERDRTAQPWRGEIGVRRSGLYLASVAGAVIASAVEPMPDTTVRLRQAAPRIPIRPWPDEQDPSYPLPLVTRDWAEATDYYAQSALAWPSLLALESPTSVRLNVIRVGSAVVCTSPAELFVEFGIQVKAASPAPVTLVAELTDGYVGYVPTPLAFERGGYETWPAPSSKLIPEAGDIIVSETRRLLGEAFAQ